MKAAGHGHVGGETHVVGYDDDPTTTITDAARAQFLRLLCFLRLYPFHWEGNRRVQRAGASWLVEWRCGSRGLLIAVADLHVDEG